MIKNTDSSLTLDHVVDLKLCLYENWDGIHNFPEDELGTYTISYRSKKYKCLPNVLRYCELFKSKLNKDCTELEITLKNNQSEEAFDLIMKLLFGFKDVIIPHKEQIPLLTILYELGINDKNNFRSKAEDYIILRVNSLNVLEAFQASMQFNLNSLLGHTLSTLTSIGFKILLTQSAQVNCLEEDQFMKLMNTMCDEKKKSSNTEKFPKLFEIKKIIENYCSNRYTDMVFKQEKIKKFKELYMSAPIPDPNEADIEPKIEEQSKLEHKNVQMNNDLIKEFETLKLHYTKLDQDNIELKKENKALREDLDSLSVQVKALLQTMSNIENSVLHRTKTQEENSQCMQNVGGKLLKLDLKINNPVFSHIIKKNCVEFDSSVLLTSIDQCISIKFWIPKINPILKLLYRGSRDTFTAAKFHELCDNKAPTLSIIKSEHGNYFGGYTEEVWNHNNSRYKKDEKAFLFSLTHHERYEIKPDKVNNAIYPYSSYLMNFGGGNDLYIHDQCNLNKSSYAIFPHSYSCSKYSTISEESKKYLAGEFNFLVEEIEVFQVL